MLWGFLYRQAPSLHNYSFWCTTWSDHQDFDQEFHLNHFTFLFACSYEPNIFCFTTMSALLRVTV